MGAGEALQPLVQPEETTVAPQPEVQAGAIAIGALQLGAQLLQGAGAAQVGAGAAQLLQAGAGAQHFLTRWQWTRAGLQQLRASAVVTENRTAIAAIKPKARLIENSFKSGTGYLHMGS